MRLVSWNRAVLGCVLVFGVCIVDAIGQPPGGFGFGGRGGGRGMIGMLRIDEVRTELKLGQEEIGKLDTLATELQTASAAIREANGIAFGAFGGPGGAPPSPEDQAKQLKAAKEIAVKTKELEAKLTSILDSGKLNRVVGLLIQRDNVRALNVDAVSSAVGITDDQKPKIQAALEKGATLVQEKTIEFFQAGDFQGFAEKQAEFLKEADAPVTALLTPDQVKKMDSLKGAKFEFPAFRGGRGPGGPGGPGAPGAGRRGPN